MSALAHYFATMLPTCVARPALWPHVHAAMGAGVLVRLSRVSSASPTLTHIRTTAMIVSVLR